MTKHLTKPIRAIHFLVLAFLMTAGTQVSSFEYKKVFTCYRVNDEKDTFAAHSTQMSRHYIHFGNHNEVVIWFNGYQYSTEEKRTYDALWNQNGAVTFLKIKARLANVIQFEMFNESENWKRLLVFDEQGLTYMAQVTWNGKIYDASYGSCEVSVGAK